MASDSDVWAGFDEYDWQEVFKYARGPRATLPDRQPSASYDRPSDGDAEHDGRSFTRTDVKRVIAHADGDNDGPDWLMLGELHDGRFFFVYAGCDYTGWGCQEGGGSYVADAPEKLIRFAMADEDRERLNLPLPA